MSARNTRRKVSPAHRGLRAGDSGLQRSAAARGKPRPVTGAGGAAEGRRARLSRNVVVSAVISTPQRVSHVKQGWRPARAAPLWSAMVNICGAPGGGPMRKYSFRNWFGAACRAAKKLRPRSVDGLSDPCSRASALAGSPWVGRQQIPCGSKSSAAGLFDRRRDLLTNRADAPARFLPAHAACRRAEWIVP